MPAPDLDATAADQPASRGSWARKEIEEAFQRYQEQVVRARESGDWTLFADLFTEDATYNEHAYGRFEGRGQIRDWVTKTMTSFPGSHMTAFPTSWHTVDEDKGWVICEIRNLMQDPGDGSVHEAPNLTILHYAGENRWKHEEDVYNPMRFLEMVVTWCRVAEEHGSLPPTAQSWLAAARRA